MKKFIDKIRNIHPKSTRNPPKTRLGRVRGALGGGLGVILAPRAARDSNRVANLGSLDAFWMPKGVPLGTHFQQFA